MTEWRQIRVRKWGDFQHYKKRRPPWIKLHVKLTHNDDWVDLSFADRGVLASVWLLWAECYPKEASEDEQEAFTISSRLVQTRLGVPSGHVHRYLDRLVQAGFIEYVLAGRKHDAFTLSTEGRESPLKAFSLPKVDSAPDPQLVVSMNKYRENLNKRSSA